jgi:4a-hydroxytetrahydrobiopterin dehydratase
VNDLWTRSCRPLRGPSHALPGEAAHALLGQLDGWEMSPGEDAISKTFRFEDHYRTMAFVNAVAWIAHREDHHPDLEVGYNRCTVRYSTHDVGGLSENDFICAAKVERLLR